MNTTIAIEQANNLLKNQKNTLEVFQSITIDKYPTQQDWLTITILIAKILNLPVNDLPITKINSNNTGSFIKLNNEYKNLHIKDATLISFNNLYPTLLYEHIINKTNDESITDFKTIFQTVFDTYKKNKNVLMKQWINFTYGILQSYDITNTPNININAKIIISEILQCLNNNIIYVDTDEIYFHNFKNVRSKFIKEIERLKTYYKHINFYEEEIDNLIIIDKKKIITYDNEQSVYTQGIKIYEN